MKFCEIQMDGFDSPRNGFLDLIKTHLFYDSKDRTRRGHIAASNGGGTMIEVSGNAGGGRHETGNDGTLLFADRPESF